MGAIIGIALWDMKAIASAGAQPFQASGMPMISMACDRIGVMH